MKLKNIFSGLLLLIVISACASTADNSNKLLWKISGNGIKSPSYLFGTHHLIPVSFLDEIDGLDQAFKASEQMIGELDMSKMMAMQMKILQKSMLPKGYSYKTLLNDADYQLLSNEVYKTLNMKFSKLEKMRPAMIQNLLMITLYQKYYPTASDGKGIDQHFQDLAKKNKMKVKGLERADDQIYILLEHQSIERQTEMLMCMIKHPELLKEQMDKMQQAYMSQNLTALNALYTENKKDDPCPSTQAEKDAMNKDRNKKWLKILPEMMHEKSSFIAVGCMHLVGDDGLITGLRKLGYKVEPVK